MSGPTSFERAVISVDMACFSLHEGELGLLLVKRTEEPFAGSWALPGGVVGIEEPLDEAARRVLLERTGIRDAYLEQLYTFGDPGRDPRGRTVSVGYYAMLSGRPVSVRSGRGSSEAAWHPARSLPQLAFDHGQIARYALWRLAQKIEYTPLAFHLLPPEFTLGDLRGVHEAVLGRTFDLSNFNRQMLARWDLQEVPGALDRRTRRPARRYRYAGAREVSGPPQGDL